MRLGLLTVVATALIGGFACSGPNGQPSGDASVSAEERVQWFREAKFGMFIHWGPYSNLAGEWKGRQVKVGQNAEWIMNILRIPAAEYRQAARRFNPVKFDAEAWVKLAAATGMKYLVITAKHHDGFAMYHSRVSEYNIVDWTPFGRDPLKELAEACRKHGIRFCVYYSHREDWNEPDAYGNFWDFDKSKKDFEKYLEEKSKPQVRELLTGYGPLGLVWFDRGLYTPEQARAFANLVHGIQPHCLVNGRVGNYGQELMGDYQDLNDNGMPPGGVEEYWETPQTLNETWGYSNFDHHWKSPRAVIRRLVEIVSKGGNYLLNIGPKGDGAIPVPTLSILDRVGAWVRWNGESVYGTSASPFPKLAWGLCTVNGSKLYLHVFDWPEDGVLRLSGLRNRIRRAYPLLDASHALDARKDGSTVSIHLPKLPLDEDDTVIVLEIDGAPDVEPPIVIQKEAAPVELDYLAAVTSGKAVKRFNRVGKFHISKWTDPGDSASWRIKISRAGRYDVSIKYAARGAQPGAQYHIAVNSQSLVGTVENTGDWYEYKEFRLGGVEFAAPGEYEVTIHPESAIGHDLMYFQSMRLTPAE